MRRLNRWAWTASAVALLFVMALAFGGQLQRAAAADQPTVTGVSPNSGPAAGGTTVTVTGTNFTGATDVKFAATPAMSFTVVDATHITAVSPTHAAGQVDVTITTPDGTSAVNVNDRFTFIAAPTVTALTPATGSTAGGTLVQITGTNLTGVTSVLFGSTPAGFTFVNDTTINAVSPLHAAGPVDVTVVTPGGTSATGAGTAFTYTAGVPVVVNVNPATGPLTGGQTVTVTGSGFTGATDVTFGTIAGTNVTIVDDTTLTVVSPAAATPGAVDVRVTTLIGTSIANPATDRYTYVSTAAPTVTGISPTGGPIAGGTVVTITGTGFTGATSVTFGGNAASAVTVNSDTSITATSPAHAAGAVDVIVTTSNGSSAASDNSKFTYGALPVVSGVSPASGPAGTAVTITGTGFTGATSVLFGTTAVTPTTVTDTSITVTAPANVSGTVNVFVVTPSGTSTEVSAGQFTFTAGTITYTLAFRWSLIVWNGADNVSIAATLKGLETPDNPATNDISGQVTAIFRWNATAQKWEGYFPGSENIPGANDFTVFNRGTAYWIAIKGPSSITWTVLQG